MAELEYGYSDASRGSIREHTEASSNTYIRPRDTNWQDAPGGVDVVKNGFLIQKTFPSFDKSVQTLIHVMSPIRCSKKLRLRIELV
jgi:hypothetical protein